MKYSQTFFSPLLNLAFRCHDAGCAWVVLHIRPIKVGILMLAHLTLLGFLFPQWRKDFGEWAGYLLIALLFLSPISALFRARFLLLMMGLRRELGILMAYLATVHGIGYLIDPAWRTAVILPYWPGDVFGIDPAMLFGIAGYVLTLPLLLTSNNLATRILGGQRWKHLHRLAYPVLLLVVMHRLLLQDDERGALLQAMLLLGAYGVLKLLARHNFLPPFARAITWVALRYGEWKKPIASLNQRSNV